MTVGSNRNGLGQNGSTHSEIPPRDGRETLSALFDGELHGDAARFALKRLDHDVEWREACGRWQLIGDALRGQATVLAPADFAAGIGRALDDERVATAATAIPTAPDAPSRRRWVGGAALAASVAVAAVLAIRPWTAEPEPAAPIVARTAPAPASSTPAEQVASAAVSPTPATAPASGLAGIKADAMVPADEGTSAQRSRTLAAAPGAPARPVPRVRPPTPARQADPIVGDPPVAIAASAPTRSPFHPPGEPIVTRPWPRAVLPDAAPGGLTVGFGEGAVPAASLYPFEPRLPAESASAESRR